MFCAAFKFEMYIPPTPATPSNTHVISYLMLNFRVLLINIFINPNQINRIKFFSKTFFFILFQTFN